MYVYYSDFYLIDDIAYIISRTVWLRNEKNVVVYMHTHEWWTGIKNVELKGTIWGGDVEELSIYYLALYFY